MDVQERQRLQQLVDAAHHTAAALVHATMAARASWSGAPGTAPGWGTPPAPGGGTLTSHGANANTEARMYGYGATSWPGFIPGGYGYLPVGPSPYAGFIPFAGPAYGVGIGLTHAGPGTIGPGVLGATPFGIPGMNNLGNLGFGRPYGIAHAGPETLIPGSPLLGGPGFAALAGFPPTSPSFGWGINPGLASGFVGVPLAPAWSTGASGIG